MTDTPTGRTGPTEPMDPTPTAPYDPPPPPSPAPAATPGPAASPPPPPPVAPAPTWRMRRDDPGRTGTIVFGVILAAIGLWFFADQTLGLEMPRLRWSELWPILLIGLGAWIVFGSLRRDR
ncbi:MAG TPA: DUF5668 domain-containing protein [Candidatus Limnocylindrales bacterium]|nr:DUF5668 domain-containing protein [Candidatus Limnocylindrales bacterium]